MAKESFELPIYWNDHEDIAMGLYEKFGDDFGESQIYRIRFIKAHSKNIKKNKISFL